MQAVEFEAEVRNLSIHVPSKFSVLEKKHVKLVALYEDATETVKTSKSHSFIEDIMANPIRVKRFAPLKRDEIYAGQHIY